MAGIKPAMTLLEMRAVSLVVMAGLVPAIHVLLSTRDALTTNHFTPLLIR